MALSFRGVLAAACVLYIFVSCVAQTGNHKSMKEFKQRFKKFTDDCNKQVQSNTPATMGMFYNHTNYMQGKCFIHCMLVKFELVDKSGVFLVKEMKESISRIPSEKTKTLAAKNIDACLQQVPAADSEKNGNCKKAFSLANCLFQTSVNKQRNEKN